MQVRSQHDVQRHLTCPTASPWRSHAVSVLDGTVIRCDSIAGMNAVAEETRKDRAKSQSKRVVGRPFQKGNPGKPRGAVDGSTRSLRGMILQALSDAGGVKWLEKQAHDNPVAFMGLVGKVLPLDVTSSDGSMRPVVALYMPDNRRDGDSARVIEHAPAKAIQCDVEATVADTVEAPAYTVADRTL